ncbi:hypothetical protein PFISCL1PPCAC_26419, partial [Pristionchus fissidentatus]
MSTRSRSAAPSKAGALRNGRMRPARPSSASPAPPTKKYRGYADASVEPNGDTVESRFASISAEAQQAVAAGTERGRSKRTTTALVSKASRAYEVQKTAFRAQKAAANGKAVQKVEVVPSVEDSEEEVKENSKPEKMDETESASATGDVPAEDVSLPLEEEKKEQPRKEEEVDESEIGPLSAEEKFAAIAAAAAKAAADGTKQARSTRSTTTHNSNSSKTMKKMKKEATKKRKRN